MSKKYYLTAALAFLFLLPLHSFGDSSPLRDVAVSQIEAYLVKKANRADAEAARLLSLVRLGKEVLQIENYFVAAYVNDGGEISGFSAYDLRRRWRDAIAARPAWDHKLAPSAKALLLEQQIEFKEVFSDYLYELAWLKKMAGDDSGAKTALKAVFENEFASLMKMDKVYTGMDRGPMHQINLAWGALSPVCTSTEKREYEEKMKKVKVHISTLPQIVILT